MIRTAMSLTVLCLLVLAGCAADPMNRKMDRESIAGQWRMICKNGDQSRDLGTTFTFYEDGSWNSVYQAAHKYQPYISGGRFVIEGNTVRIFSVKKKKEQEETWTVVNPNLLEDKNENTASEDKTLPILKQNIFLERIK